MVRKRFASVLCTVAGAVGYVVGTYGDTIVIIMKRIVDLCSTN